MPLMKITWALNMTYLLLLISIVESLLGDNCDKCIKGGLKSHNESVQSYYCNKGGINMRKESVHKDRSYYCDKCGFPAAKKKKLKSHMETAHRDEDFNVTSVISR